MDTIAVGAVSNVFYFVADLAGASAWYRQLLGAEPRTTMPQLVEFDVGGSVLTLHANDEFNAGGAGVGTVAYWTTPDVDRAVAVCVARGGSVHRGPKTVFSGDRLCQVLDPFANLLGLRQPAAEPPARP
jgi:predicted enzyme related to lactoylglutathione lyase